MNQSTTNFAPTTTTKLRVGQCVYVRWQDDHAPAPSTITRQKHDHTNRATVGWISRKTDRILALIPNVDPNETIPPTQTTGPILIPIPMITSIRRLSLPT